MSAETEIAKSFCGNNPVCKSALPCEYKSIYTLINSNIVIFETDDGLLRYYNTLTGNLSPFYTSVSCDEAGSLYCFGDNKRAKETEMQGIPQQKLRPFARSPIAVEMTCSWR